MASFHMISRKGIREDGVYFHEISDQFPVLDGFIPYWRRKQQEEQSIGDPGIDHSLPLFAPTEQPLNLIDRVQDSIPEPGQYGVTIYLL